MDISISILQYSTAPESGETEETKSWSYVYLCIPINITSTRYAAQHGRTEKQKETMIHVGVTENKIYLYIYIHSTPFLLTR